MEPQAILQDLFTAGFKSYPDADPKRADSQPYLLGFSAAAKLAEIEEARIVMIEKVRELSGGNIGRVGFV